MGLYERLLKEKEDGERRRVGLLPALEFLVSAEKVRESCER